MKHKKKSTAQMGKEQNLEENKTERFSKFKEVENKYDK